MHKKIICAMLAVLIVSGAAACTKTDNEPETTSTEAVTTTAAVSETEATTVTTTAPPTTVTTTSKPVTSTTEKLTTTKKVTTTVKKVVTTIVETTAESTTKKEVVSNLRSEDKSENLLLKYGVLCTRTIKTTYAELEDGTQEVYDEDIAEVYTRIGYNASYDDLLPAAEENKNKYESEIEEVLDIINSYRKEGGLEPLVLDEKLTTVACARAEEIAWSGRHSHYRPNGKFFSSILKDAGITEGKAGENIGWGYPEASAVCEAWKNSKTHYENIMNPDFKKIGIGVAADPDPKGKLCWSQLFIDK